jgi:flagellar biogenesis protein FliO
MTEVSFTDLVVRMVLSLAIVLGLVLIAYAVIRRRQGLGGGGSLMRRAGMLGGGSGKRSKLGKLARPKMMSMSAGSILGPGRSVNSRSARMPGARRGLRVVGRVGIGRTTQVVAVQFAEKVFLLGASETNAPTILAELDMAAWLEATEGPEHDSTRTSAGTSAEIATPIPTVAGGQMAAPTGLLDALREATTRRG